jgi:hypothetical protein
MASNRIGGTSPSDPSKGPDTRMQEQHRKVEKVEKVKAVDETENEHTRKKFQRFMNEEETFEKPRMPSPLETGFYKDEETVLIDPSRDLEDFENDAIPSPTYSPQPNVNRAPKSSNDENPPLPQNDDFWKHVDTPSNGPIPNPKFKEKKKSSSHQNIDNTKKKEQIFPQEKSGSLYGPPGKPTKEHTHIVSSKEKSKSHEKTPSSNDIKMAISERPDEKKNMRVDDIKKEKKKTLPSLPMDHETISSHNKTYLREDDEESRRNKRASIQIDSLPSEQIPSSIIPIAETATIQASPYLSSETIPLFFQMVGTIYVMTAPPGISKTEIVLSSPAFANSKFFGATISIEKYATAPDSLNIRLTGTNEAVKTFNENLSNLYAAFQNGNFGFRIGRISAEYSIERPVFRRKEPGEGRRESGGGDMSEERGKR